MAKHCTNCGHELGDTDKFCAECGKSVGGNSNQVRFTDDTNAKQAPAERWETCEIVWNDMTERPTGLRSLLGYQRKFRFWASAIGPHGKYSAGESIVVNSLNEDASPEVLGTVPQYQTDACNELLRQLLSEGWDVLSDKSRTNAYWGLQEIWYGYRLRRLVTDDTAKSR